MSTTNTGDDTGREGRIAEARRLRTEEGWSKHRIAERLGVSTGTLTRWLRGLEAPQWTRRPNAKDDLRERARARRRAARSVPEIATELGVSKSTAYRWVRDIPLDTDAPVRRDRREHSKIMAETRWAVHREERDRRRAQVAASAGSLLPAMSEGELLRLGALVYWCEGTKSKPWREAAEVQFINSDPGLIALFLAFLTAAGVSADRVRYRVTIHESADVERSVAWWAALVGVPPDVFQRTTLKRHNPKTVRRNTGDDYRGCLVVRVLRSRELYWQIEGMVRETTRSTGRPLA